MNVIILLFLIAFAWYVSGLMADSYALKKRIRELEKEIERYKDTINQICEQHEAELKYYTDNYG